MFIFGERGMASIHIYLRDLRTTPCTFLVQVEREDSQKAIQQDEEDGFCDYEAALAEFAALAQSVEPGHDKIDVYIAWYGDQGTIKFSQEFTKLIASRDWPVELDINE